MKFNATYASWPLAGFADDEKFATLAVLYDHLYLPYPFLLADFTLSSPQEAYDMMRIAKEEYAEWYFQMSPLISAGVISFLPRPTIPVKGFVNALFNARQKGKLVEFDPRGPLADAFNAHIRSTIVNFHILYGKRMAPQVFGLPDASRTTPALTDLLGSSLLKISVPSFGLLTPEQILEARSDLQSARVGLIMTLQGLCDDLKTRLSDSEQSAVVASAETIQRKLLPALKVGLSENNLFKFA
jgi:hypothetical protein